MSVVLLDIEGTTTSIAFVYDTLFPYARTHARAFLESNLERADVDRAVGQLFQDAGPQLTTLQPSGRAARIDDICAEITRQMDADLKAGGLKALQGLIWADGYASGALRGHVFDDVAPALARWNAAGHRVAIYSSGSVAAQKLLFGGSVAGDLTPHLCAYFDTTTGPKKVAASYVAIASALEVPPAAMVFATDNPDEARAARTAGVPVWFSLRPGNPPADVSDLDVRVIEGFAAVDPI